MGVARARRAGRRRLRHRIDGCRSARRLRTPGRPAHCHTTDAATIARPGRRHQWAPRGVRYAGTAGRTTFARRASDGARPSSRRRLVDRGIYPRLSIAIHEPQRREPPPHLAPRFRHRHFTVPTGTQHRATSAYRGRLTARAAASRSFGDSASIATVACRARSRWRNASSGPGRRAPRAPARAWRAGQTSGSARRRLMARFQAMLTSQVLNDESPRKARGSTPAPGRPAPLPRLLPARAMPRAPRETPPPDDV